MHNFDSVQLISKYLSKSNIYRIHQKKCIYYSNMNGMNWDGLRYFLAAAESGSLSSAAKTLGSNQPTVGRYIDALESALEVKLFQRSVKGLSLTEEGQYIYEQTQHIQNSVVKIERAVQGGKETVSGTARLSVPEGLGLEILTPSLDNFYQRYPHIKLIIDVSSTAANLTHGDADVALRLFRPEHADLVVKYLGKMKMGLFVSEKYKENYGLPSGLKDLYQHRVIAYGDQLSALPENKWLLEHSDESSRVLCSDSTMVRLKATVSGVGISIQPEVLIQTNSDLLQIFEKTPLPPHKVWLVYHKDLRHMARIRAVVDFISVCIGGLLAE